MPSTAPAASGPQSADYWSRRSSPLLSAAQDALSPSPRLSAPLQSHNSPLRCLRLSQTPQPKPTRASTAGGSGRLPASPHPAEGNEGVCGAIPHSFGSPTTTRWPPSIPAKTKRARRGVFLATLMTPCVKAHEQSFPSASSSNARAMRRFHLPRVEENAHELLSRRPSLTMRLNPLVLQPRIMDRVVRPLFRVSRDDVDETKSLRRHSGSIQPLSSRARGPQHVGGPRSFEAIGHEAAEDRIIKALRFVHEPVLLIGKQKQLFKQCVKVYNRAIVLADVMATSTLAKDQYSENHGGKPQRKRRGFTLAPKWTATYAKYSSSSRNQKMDRDDVDDANVIAEEIVDAHRARARWKKLRAATLVFLLFRRRVHHDTRHGNKQPQKRMPTSVFFAELSLQAATAAAAQRLSTNQPPAAASPQVTRWFAQKLHIFKRIGRKAIQCRDDVDIKILGDFIRQTKFFHGLTSASIDALAQVLRFRTYHEGEVLHLQGSQVQDTSGRYLVVTGSLLVYKSTQYALRAREGEEYIEWFLTNTPGATRDNIRYGDCIETCAAGDITGDDATLERLFREHSVISQVKTVIAYVTQADYKRVIRFNVDNEPQLLEAVRETLSPQKVSKQNLHRTKFKEPSLADSSVHPELSSHQVRLLMRFLGRFRCFRILPLQFCMDIVAKMQLSTVKSDEVVCISSDDTPSMVMVLDGILCVHVHESHESQLLVSSEADRVEGRPHSGFKTVSPQTAEYLPGCEAGSTVASSVGANSLHVCTLTAGDSFGELAISDPETHIQGASIYHPFTTSGHMAATVVRITRHHYIAALQRYTETTDFNLTTVSSILSRSLPQDRTDEQVQYMKSFFLLRSSAKLFFGQLPSRVLDGLLLHADIDRQDVEEDIEEFIQKEGSQVDSMRIVLNGYVGVFKGTGSTRVKLATDSGIQKAPIAPDGAELRRHQSRLIRANTHTLDTSGAKRGGHPGSIQKNPQAPPRLVLPKLDDGDSVDSGVANPVSVLPSGAAFGHLQILMGQSTSPYSYAAFASGSGVFDDSINATTDSKHATHLLRIPARYVTFYLASLDGQLVYNPVRAIKRLQHANFSVGTSEALAASTIRRSQLSLLLIRNKAFAGIPKKIASAMIEQMDVVEVEPRRVIYEVGEPIRRALFVVLSGSVRVFSYVSKTKTGSDRKGPSHSASDQNKLKLSRRISQESPDSRQEEPVGCGELPLSFSKPADDSIFLSDYNQTTELGCGDSFGRDDAHSFTNSRIQKLSSGPSGSNRQAQLQCVYAENVVSMTECVLGVAARRENQCEMSSDERGLLVRIIDDRDDDTWSGTDRIDEDSSAPAVLRTFDSLATSFQVLEAMDLSHRLPTQDRVRLASRLKYLKLAPGETVYKQGEASEAIYFVLFGSVTLYLKGSSEWGIDPGIRASVSNNFENVLLEVMEGEVFGDEAFESSHGCTRRCSVVTTVDDSRETVLVYVSRSDFEWVVDGKTKSHTKGSQRQAESKKETSLRLLGLGQRKISAREHWKVAILQVIQLRAQRSQWPTVLMKARNHRIDLLLDLVKDLPAFEDAPISVAKDLCCNAVLQTFAQDTMIYSKSDVFVDTCYLVIQGSVTLYQTYYSNAVTNTTKPSLRMPDGSIPQGDYSSIRVPIQVIKPGEMFGEFEMMEEHPRRHINAMVGTMGTKLVVIQQDDFFAFWPKREWKERKLSVLKTRLRDLCRLDSDQLCSLYYGMKERTFRRNEVITGGNKDQASYLHVIQDGVCVVHDSVVLKQKKSDTTNRLPTKLALDTRVSTVGSGTILFTDHHDLTSSIENRRTSSRSQDSAETAVPVEPLKSTQYVVVDSPTVTTFCVQLFPKRMAASQRQPDLLVTFLLGKTGLQIIRRTVEMQVYWRAENVAQTGRLVAASFSQHSDRPSPFVKSHGDVESEQRHRMAKPTSQQDICKALLHYDAGNTSPRPNASPHKPMPPSPRHCYDVSLITPHQSVTFGSFSPVAKPQLNQLLVRDRASAKPTKPILPSLASCATTTVGLASASPKSPRCEALSSGLGLDHQLRKQERVLVAMTKPTPCQDVFTKTQQQLMRRRHGRPPPKRVENSSEFVDEHAVVPMMQIRDEHERKKASLCRTLLHVKVTTQR